MKKIVSLVFAKAVIQCPVIAIGTTITLAKEITIATAHQVKY